MVVAFRKSAWSIKSSNAGRSGSGTASKGRSSSDLAVTRVQKAVDLKRNENGKGLEFLWSVGRRLFSLEINHRNDEISSRVGKKTDSRGSKSPEERNEANSAKQHDDGTNFCETSQPLNRR
jgi:hypothetical protein